MRKICPSPDLLEEGLRHHQAGRIEEAAKNYRQILSADPRQPDAMHLLGVIAQTVGRLDEALELISESLRLNPSNISAMNNLAGVLKDQARYEDAAGFYEAAIEADPNSAYIHSNLGNVLQQLGRGDEAANCHRRALELDPQSYAAHCNLGAVLKEQGHLAEASEFYRAAIALNPQAHEAHVNLGVVFKEQAKFAEAEASFMQALSIQPESDAALTNLGATFKEQGRLPEAIGSLRLALRINPRSHFALLNLGNALKDAGDFVEAGECLRHAVALKPNWHLAHSNLGTVFNQLGQAEHAAECFRRALELKPDYHPAHSNLLFTLNYLPGTDRAALFAEHRRFDTQFCQGFSDLISLHQNTIEPERRLRIGFVSGDLREHSVAHFIAPVFTRHDAAAFEIFCYANQTVSDGVTARLRETVEHWREVAGLSDEELADAIRRDRIDILVDLSGHTARHRLLVFARKPAPIQVSMIGYMQTTGLSAMDYRITDEHLDPTGVSDPFNTEKLIRLPAGAAAFQTPIDSPRVNELPALSNGHVTFASFNNLAKVSPAAVAAWAEILRRQPNAQLLVVGRAGNSLQSDFEKHGISADRLDFRDRLPMREFLELHHQVDFLLDTFPYNGGTTSLLALWMGVPMVTLAGEGTVSRTGAGILQGVGLSRLVASSVEEYVTLAVSETSDLAALATLRQSLRAKLLPSLEDPGIFTSQLEGAFRDIWRKWCAKSGDDSLHLPLAANC